MNNVLVVGGSGMAGHIITLYLDSMGMEVTSLSRSGWGFKREIKLDASNLLLLEEVISKNHFDVVVNSAGILNKDAESHPEQAYLINTRLPHELDKLSKKYNFFLIHLSTDCVFKGNKYGGYTELSTPDATDIYGITKAKGEIENDRTLTIRTSIIGPDMKINGIGLFNWFIKQKTPILGYNKVFWSGITTLELSKVILRFIKLRTTGIYHVTNNKKISKYELLCLLNEFRMRRIQIKKYEEIVSDKSISDTRNVLNSVPSYQQMVNDMHIWIKEHKEFYDHIVEELK